MKFKKIALASTIIVSTFCSQIVLAADTIKVGVLHSLSGTMAISETTLRIAYPKNNPTNSPIDKLQYIHYPLTVL